MSFQNFNKKIVFLATQKADTGINAGWLQA